MKRKIALSLICALAMGACTRGQVRDKNKTITVDSEGIVNDKSLSSAEKGERLALAAEQLLTPASFMYANDVADVALSYDKNNMRAQLIKVLVKPAILSKGILVRVKPLMESTERGKQEYQKMIEDSAKWPNNALVKFAFDGQADIKTEADAQKFIAGIAKAYDDQRLFFKNHKDLELTLHVPDMWQASEIDSRAKDCQAEKQAAGNYSVTCDFSNLLEYKINRAENESAQQIAAGMEMFVTLYNGYRADGVIDYLKSIQGRDESQISGRETFEQLLKNKRFGTVRDNKALKSVLALGLDGVAGTRWAMAMQAELCKNGMDSRSQEANRPGYVIKDGICIDTTNRNEDGQSVDQVLNTVEMALRGGILNATFTVNEGANFGKQVNTRLRPAAIFSNPIQDVRDLGPFTYSQDGGSVTAFGDKTIGGIFVNGDGNEIISLGGATLKVHGQ
jgi:hypothetical protein